MQIAHSHILLDACCVLNFCASGKLLAILKSIFAQVTVALVVQERELKTLQRLKSEDNEGVIQFETAIEQGLLVVVDFESEDEAESFVNYAAVLGDDGESATCAIAIHRGWAIATDDKKAIAFFQQIAPYLQVLSTPDIIKHWSDEAGVDSSTLRDVLNAIRSKGRYFPHKSHPLRSWWEIALTQVD
jgi:predicted nucleic acid-binding protein